MFDNLLLMQLVFVLLHYLIGTMFFWYFKHTMSKFSKVVNDAVKSPRNRMKLELHMKVIEKNKKRALIWPLIMLSDLKDEIKK